MKRARRSTKRERKGTAVAASLRNKSPAELAQLFRDAQLEFATSTTEMLEVARVLEEVGLIAEGTANELTLGDDPPQDILHLRR